MDFAFSARTQALQEQLLDFMDSRVYPGEPVFEEQCRRLADPWERPAIVDELKAEARRRGLWNLFLPDPRFGAGLSNLEYAPLAEITGRSPAIAPEALNCAAPDTGNMEILAMFGTNEQQSRWLRSLLDGDHIVLRAKDDHVPRHRRGSHDHLVQLILRELFERRPRLRDDHVAVFGGQIDPAVGGNGRR